MKVVHVVAAVIRNEQGQVFIAKRPEGAHQGGKLEFPGGKRESNETRLAALKRELQEELGIQVVNAQPLIGIEHSYPEKTVLLDVWEVHEYQGEAYGAEGQETFWLNAGELQASDFPAANVPIISAINLPRLLMVSSDEQDHDSLISSLTNYQRQLKSYDFPHIYIRVEDSKSNEFDLVNVTRNICDNVKVFSRHGCADSYRHATSKALSLDATQKYRSASVHNIKELELAQNHGVEFVILGSIKPTSSHPFGDTLGWDTAKAIIAKSTVPVYLVGGMQLSDLGKAIEIGAHGIAGIRLFQD